MLSFRLACLIDDACARSSWPSCRKPKLSIFRSASGEGGLVGERDDEEEEQAGQRRSRADLLSPPPMLRPGGATLGLVGGGVKRYTMFYTDEPPQEILARIQRALARLRRAQVFVRRDAHKVKAKVMVPTPRALQAAMRKAQAAARQNAKGGGSAGGGGGGGEEGKTGEGKEDGEQLRRVDGDGEEVGVVVQVFRTPAGAPRFGVQLTRSRGSVVHFQIVYEAVVSQVVDMFVDPPKGE